MKDYFKRFIILKRLRGQENCTLKIEGQNGTSTVYGELFSSSFTRDKYTLYYSHCNGDVKVYKLLNPRFEVQINKDIKNGFSALILQGDHPILYGGYGECLSESELYLNAPNNIGDICYDDEVIATENYYEVENEKQGVFIKTDGGGLQNENSPPKEEKEGGTLLYENSNCREKQNYYDTVKDKLDGLISLYQRDYTLCSLIPYSDFAKINYDVDRFYSVGKVLENSEVKFICYAVVGSYQGAPDKLKNFCEFLPLSPFNPLGDGYYVIFQNAKTGEIVKKTQQ